MDRLSPLTSVALTRAVLERYGLATKKALGQHFLISDGILQRICALADVGQEDVVLEVGPGIGTLTIALLKKAGFVIAVERDKDLEPVLADTCAGFASHFQLISKDALELAEGDLRCAKAAHPPNKFVANLPYAVAATLVLGFFERFPSLESATVMVQREVADRMCAQPGTKAYGAYTVKLALAAQTAGRFAVGSKNFFPPPRVESAVLRLDRCQPADTEGRPLSAEALQAARVMADAAFANRRKTLLNSCKAYFEAMGTEGLPWAQALPRALEEADIDPKLRGEALAVADFISLGQALLDQGL